MEQNSQPRLSASGTDGLPHQRKIVIIKRLMQMKYVSLVGLTAIFTTLIILLDLFYIFGKLLSTEMEEKIVASLFADVSVLLAIHLPIFFLIVIVISIFISHKFAGPVFRLEKVAEAIGEGDLSVRIHLRKGDELFDTAEQMNRMIDSLAMRIAKEKNLSARVADRLSTVARQMKSHEISPEAAVKKLEELQLELNHIGSNFKLQ